MNVEPMWYGPPTEEQQKAAQDALLLNTAAEMDKPLIDERFFEGQAIGKKIDLSKYSSPSDVGSSGGLGQSIMEILNGDLDYQRAINQLAREYDYNLQLQNSANEFSRNEAALTRQYNAEQALLDRLFNSSEASKARSWEEAMYKSQQEYNAAEAEKNRQYQLYMSNTAYQRAIADLKAAGLNPYLAYAQGGAPVTTGSSASAGIPSAASASGYAASSSAARGTANSVRASVGKGSQLASIVSSFMYSAMRLGSMLAWA